MDGSETDSKNLPQKTRWTLSACRPCLLTGFFIGTLAVSGCATYQGKVSEARTLLTEGRSEEAVAKLEPLAKTDDKDQLVYILDLATAQQVAGQYKDSTKSFILADRMAEDKDYTSVSRVAGSLLLSEEMVQYRGEDFEKLLINSMAAISYVLAGDLESAMVETRRSTEKLNYYRLEQKKEYSDNSFVPYLNGHLWEASRNFDSAYIDFRRAYDMGLRTDLVRHDLLRVAKKGNKQSTLAKLRSEFSIEPDLQWQKKGMGELVLLFQQGWGPRKRPNPEAPRFPILVPERAQTKKAQLQVTGFDNRPFTEVVYDLETAAVATLNSQYASLVAKRIAGMVAKDVVARKVGKDNAALGSLLFIAMHAADRADLRQWSTLPQTVQVARMDLPEGAHTVQVQGFDGSGYETSDKKTFDNVEIKAGKKTFIGWRSLR
jgi:uncharacterized protein